MDDEQKVTCYRIPSDIRGAVDKSVDVKQSDASKLGDSEVTCPLGDACYSMIFRGRYLCLPMYEVYGFH